MEGLDCLVVSPYCLVGQYKPFVVEFKDKTQYTVENWKKMFGVNSTGVAPVMIDGTLHFFPVEMLFRLKEINLASNDFLKEIMRKISRISGTEFGSFSKLFSFERFLFQVSLQIFLIGMQCRENGMEVNWAWKLLNPFMVHQFVASQSQATTVAHTSVDQSPGIEHVSLPNPPQVETKPPMTETTTDPTFVYHFFFV